MNNTRTADIALGLGIVQRLQHQPVRHNCGHFETRLMRAAYVDAELGYGVAGSVCSQCESQGRPLQISYPTLDECRAACTELDIQTGRQ